MNELFEKLREEFKDKETRHIYADDFLNTFIASQLKVLREDREWTQTTLAEEAGMKQERISVLEDVNYESWSVKTLKRLAKAFDLRLSIKFETFGSFLSEFDQFNREILSRPSFESDPAFNDQILNAASLASGITASSTETSSQLRALVASANSTAVQYNFRSSTPPVLIENAEGVATSNKPLANSHAISARVTKQKVA